MSAARDLVSEDPYATATRLLQVGAQLSMRTAGMLLSGRSYDTVLAFAAQADTDESAAEVLRRLVNTGVGQLSRLGLNGLVGDLFSSTGGNRRWGS